jgi:hypothetical protein
MNRFFSTGARQASKTTFAVILEETSGGGERGGRSDMRLHLMALEVSEGT